jgi:protein phosphatase
MAVRVGRELGMSMRELGELEVAALLHDFGRTEVARDILAKGGSLSAEERAEMRQHPRVGHGVVKALGFLDGAAEIVHCHHEQPDGKGYPRGLTSQDIPRGSRIIMAVAAFDAMTSDRPYRTGLEPEAAIEELLENAGTQFFPEVVEAFIRLYSSGQLFSEFTDEELREYVGGNSNSRALEEHARSRGLTAPMPEKRGAGEGQRVGGPQILELPEAPATEPVTARLRAGKGYRLKVAGVSDLGCLRETNEDRFAFVEGAETGLLIVADGMGGAAAGEVASRIAVETVEERFLDGADSRPDTLMREAFEEANRRISTQAADDPEKDGMGTTCSAALVNGHGVWLTHVGDSRVYLVAGQEINQLTRDHNLAMELERLSAGSSVHSIKPRNILTRCLGVEEPVDIDADVEPVALHEGDTLVLCTDGLSGQVGPDEIRDLASDRSPENAAKALVELARERGGPDNITVVVARVERA